MFKNVRYVLLAFTSLGFASDNLVQNGDFATNDFTDWTTSGSGLAVLGDPGTHCAGFGSTNITLGVISQSLSTLPGGEYRISFSLKNAGCAEDIPPNKFTAEFGTTRLWDLNDQAAFDWTTYTSTEVADSSSTLLQFSGRNNADYFVLTHISVVALAPPLQKIFLLVG